MDFLITAQLILCTILTLFAVLQAIQQFFYQWQQSYKGQNRRPRGKKSHSWRTDPKNRQLQSHLLNLLQGDVPTAKRLLQYQRRMHPGNSDNWYLEKVIWDLERDRGR